VEDLVEVLQALELDQVVELELQAKVLEVETLQLQQEELVEVEHLLRDKT
jgi:hypothetical protein